MAVVSRVTAYNSMFSFVDTRGLTPQSLDFSVAHFVAADFDRHLLPSLECYAGRPDRNLKLDDLARFYLLSLLEALDRVDFRAQLGIERAKACSDHTYWPNMLQTVDVGDLILTNWKIFERYVQIHQELAVCVFLGDLDIDVEIVSIWGRHIKDCPGIAENVNLFIKGMFKHNLVSIGPVLP